jgi:hypothetical protein
MSSKVLHFLKNKMGGKIDCYVDCGRIASLASSVSLTGDLA